MKRKHLYACICSTRFIFSRKDYGFNEMRSILHASCNSLQRWRQEYDLKTFHLKFLVNQHFLINFLHSQKGVKRVLFEFIYFYRGSTQLLSQIENIKEMQSRVDTCNYESVWWFRLWDCFSRTLLIPTKGPLNRSYRYSHSNLEWLLCPHNDKRDNKQSLCQQHLSGAWVRQND